jgi:hypothetical protein
MNAKQPIAIVYMLLPICQVWYETHCFTRDGVADEIDLCRFAGAGFYIEWLDTTNHGDGRDE